MKSLAFAAFALAFAGAPASAAIIKQWTGHVDPSTTSVWEMLSDNLNPPVPTLVDGAKFRLDVYVTEPSGALDVYAVVAFRANEYFDGVPTGGGSGFSKLSVAPLEPGHWAGTFTSQNPPFVSQPGLYTLKYSALTGAWIDRTGFQNGPAFDYRFVISSVPEPMSWAMLIGGFGMLGAAARRREAQLAA